MTGLCPGPVSTGSTSLLAAHLSWLREVPGFQDISHLRTSHLSTSEYIVNPSKRAGREGRARQKQGEEERLSTMEEDTSATSSMGSADPGSVAAGSDLSAKPSPAGAEPDVKAVEAPTRAQLKKRLKLTQLHTRTRSNTCRRVSEQFGVTHFNFEWSILVSTFLLCARSVFIEAEGMRTDLFATGISYTPVSPHILFAFRLVPESIYHA